MKDIYKHLLDEYSNDLLIGFNPDFTITKTNHSARAFFKKLGTRITPATSISKVLHADSLLELKQYIKKKKKSPLRLIFINPVNHHVLVADGKCITCDHKRREHWLLLQFFHQKTDLEYEPRLQQYDEIKHLLNTVDIVMYRVRDVNKPRQTIEFISKNTRALFGMDFKTYMKKLEEGKLMSCFHPDDVEKIISANRILKKEKKPVREQYRFMNPVLKKYIWIEEKSFPVLNRNKEITEIIGISRNVTEQIEREEKLRASETLSRNIIEKNLAGFYRINIGGTIVEANDAFARIFGYNHRKDVIHKKPRQIYSRSTDQNTFIELIKKRGKLINHESEVVLNNGEICNILENATYFKNQVTGEEFIEGTLFNITELKKTQNALGESERRYRTLFDENMAGVFITTLSGGIVDCNNAFLKIFGYKNKAELVTAGARSLYFTQSERDQYIRELKRKKALTNHELVHRKKDGTPVYVLVNVKLDTVSGTREPVIQGTLIDISKMRAISHQMEESAEKYRTLYENASDAILIIEKNKIIDCNLKATELFKCDKKTIGRCLISDITSALQDGIFNGIEKFFNNVQDKKHTFQWIFHDKNQKAIYSEVTAVKLFEEGRELTQCIIRDITERVKKEKELLLEMENYQQLIEHSPDGNLIVDNGIIVYANPSALHILGYPGIKEIEKRPVLEFFAKRYRQEIQKLFTLAAKNTNTSRLYEYRMHRTDGNEVDVGLQVVPVKYHGRDCMNLILYDLALKTQLAQEQLRAQVAEETADKLIAEIKEHKVTQAKLAEQVAYIRSILESSANIAFFTLDRNGHVTSCNHSFEKMAGRYFNYDIKKHPAFFDFMKKYIAKENYNVIQYRIHEIFKGHSGHLEGPVMTRQGEKLWFETYFNPIHIPGNDIEEISVLATEITDRKQRNEQLRQSLKEKEVLLKEVHHRVKNNLQIISSILNLQSSFSKDDEVNEILKESQNRIKSMSFIHESLYQTKNFSHINMSEYVRNLSRSLVHSYYIGNHFVTLNLDLGTYNLPLDQAIPCGLIINELITNSLKYAFTDGEKAIIGVSIREPSKGILEIEISDNGKGFPKGFNIAKTPTLGLQLVTSLVEQLEGELEVDSANTGVTVKIKFKKQPTN